MPIKRKRKITKTMQPSIDALERWRQIRPAGIERQGDCAILTDDCLAEALGLPILLWLREAADLFHQLEAPQISAELHFKIESGLTIETHNID